MRPSRLTGSRAVETGVRAVEYVIRAVEHGVRAVETDVQVFQSRSRAQARLKLQGLPAGCKELKQKKFEVSAGEVYTLKCLLQWL